MKKQPLLNVKVNNVTMDEALQEVCCLIEEKRDAYIVAVNTDVIVKIEKDDYLRRIVDEASLTLVDGKPLVWVSKLQKRPVKEKISGSDLIPKLCVIAAQKGYSIFIIGGREGIAERAKENLERDLTNIKIVGTYSPPPGFENDEEELNRINQLICTAGPDIVIVCFGCPKQEKWVYENHKIYGAAVSICAGATVDFLAENVKRAPEWMRNCGMEWLYRFAQEPRRLFKRYFIDDMKILSLIIKYW